jgi:hypothetical protein
MKSLKKILTSLHGVINFLEKNKFANMTKVKKSILYLQKTLNILENSHCFDPIKLIGKKKPNGITNGEKVGPIKKNKNGKSKSSENKKNPDTKIRKKPNIKTGKVSNSKTNLNHQSKQETQEINKELQNFDDSNKLVREADIEDILEQYKDKLIESKKGRKRKNEINSDLQKTFDAENDQ